MALLRHCEQCDNRTTPDDTTWLHLSFLEESLDFCSWECVRDYANTRTSEAPPLPIDIEQLLSKTKADIERIAKILAQSYVRPAWSFDKHQ